MGFNVKASKYRGASATPVRAVAILPEDYS
jgi:hypothetical protein